ncbi:hypothetical protein Plhal304r1_c003g0011281 [Plasmopara halstedii]
MHRGWRLAHLDPPIDHTGFLPFYLDVRDVFFIAFRTLVLVSLAFCRLECCALIVVLGHMHHCFIFLNRCNS